MTTPTFESAFESLQRFYDATHDHVDVDLAAESFIISAPGVSVDDVAQLVTDVLGVDDAIPTWVPRGLRLVRLELRKASSSSGFDFTMDVLAGDVGWTIVDGLTIDQAELTLDWGAGGLSGRIGGSMSVDDLHLEVAVALPDQVLEAHLHSADGADAGVGEAFLRRNGIVAPADGVRQPKAVPILDDLSLYAGIRAHHYVVHAQVQHIFDADPFQLDFVEIQAEFGDRTSMSVWADLRIDLGTLGPVSFLAHAEVGPEGWVFEGTLRATDDFTLGELADGIVAAFGGARHVDLPPLISDAVVDHLTLGFDTSTTDLSFECELRWPSAEVAVTVALHHAEGALTARGTLEVADLRFDLVFDRSTEGGGQRTALVGVFSADGGQHVTLADVVGGLGADQSTLGDLATSFSFGIHDAVLAWERSVDGADEAGDDTADEGAAGAEHAEATTHLLFAADLDLGVDLSGLGSLPLVGSMLPRDESLRLTFRPIVSTAWNDVELEPVRDALPDGVPALPESLEHGARLDAILRLGDGAAIPLNVIDVPADGSTSPSTGDATSAPVAAEVTPVTSKADASPGDVEWKEIDRSFGPVRISQVGVHFDRASKEIELLLSGSISVAGLELTLMGLGARYGLDDQHLDVTLHGIGLDLKREPLEIAGAFANVDGDFVGKVVVRTEEFGLTAFGAFKMISGAPSMFVYGALDYPLGGPPFFFVDGLALGFGYNRGFVPPKVADVRSFPLVTDAAGSTTAPDSVDEQLARLHHAVPPSVGEYFVAVGVKFTSFKLLESFVLLVVGFGEHLEIDIIGTSTYQSPPGDLGSVPPMAKAQLDLVGRIVPDSGSILVQAQLSESSYVYNPLCHIYGGFAFASWFSGDHGGDFVLSVGGYHPHFTPPDHYPVPPRIGVTYQITPHVYVKGEGYFALTPSLFMAGAALEASAEIGSVSATFRVALDFVIGWEPYHYDAHLRIDVAAKWHCFHTSASVDLHIWGPDFAGRGEVNWTVFSFDVDFGHPSSRGPTPIGFDRFREAFLPAANKACSIRCASGLVDSVDDVIVATADGEITVTMWNVNAKELRIETSSVIPEGNGIGIAPMNRPSLTGTEPTISVTRGRHTVPAGHFLVEALPAKTYPSALWGTTIGRSLDDTPILATAGRRITVVDPVEETSPHPVPRSQLVAGTPIRAYAEDTGWSLGHRATDPGDHDVVRDYPEFPWQSLRHVRSGGGFG